MSFLRIVWFFEGQFQAGTEALVQDADDGVPLVAGAFPVFDAANGACQEAALFG